MNKLVSPTLAMRCLFAFLVLTASTDLYAHTKLENTVPAADSHLTEPPAQIELTFAADVRLVNLHVANKAGVSQDVAFKPSMKAAKAFSVNLPELGADTYTVHWVSMGSDGHKMSGDFSFMVHTGDSAVPTVSASSADHHGLSEDHNH